MKLLEEAKEGNIKSLLKLMSRREFKFTFNFLNYRPKPKGTIISESTELDESGNVIYVAEYEVDIKPISEFRNIDDFFDPKNKKRVKHKEVLNVPKDVIDKEINDTIKLLDREVHR